MLQHLINTTIIWLTGLVFFDLLLRKETFHQHNRFYLIFSLLTGIALPFAEISSYNATYAGLSLSRPTDIVTGFRNVLEPRSETIQATGVASEIDIRSIFLFIYLAGAFVAILIVAMEAIKLWKLFKSGNKIPGSGYQIIETDTIHSPFSFFNKIFIGSRTVYSSEQWHLLLAHEREHGRRLHSLDNLLLITIRIIFWFHPLVHLYYKRLRLVHEFQADEAAGCNSPAYGSFLVEQNILRGCPVLAHSFNYSPIKNRIVMLTRKRSDRIRLAKYVTTLPVVLLLILFCTQTSLSGIKPGNNKVKFNGNEIEFGSFKIIPYEYREAMEQQKKLFSYTTLPDSVLIKDPLTGIQKWHAVKHDIMPVSINGQHIYGNEEQYMLNDNEKTYSLPVFNGVEKNIYEYLFNALKDDFERLENGAYTLVIDRMVIDLNGKLAYYEPIGIRKWTSSGKSRITSSDVERSIDNKLKEALSQQIKFKPAVKDGKAVNVRTTLGNYDIIVKEHKATLVKIEGC